MRALTVKSFLYSFLEFFFFKITFSSYYLPTFPILPIHLNLFSNPKFGPEKETKRKGGIFIALILILIIGTILQEKKKLPFVQSR